MRAELVFTAGLLAAGAIAAANAAPLITTIDAPGDVGMDSSLQLNGGNLAVAYEGNTDLMYALCTAGCSGASPTWIVTQVDKDGTDTGWYGSLEFNNGNPVIAYFDRTLGDLKLATCTAACNTSSPAWVITTVDSAGEVGFFPSLRFSGGNPVVSYRDRTRGDLKLATCTSACASAAPTWVISTIDGDGDTGRYTSLRFNGASPVVSYYDVTNGLLKLATCTASCGTANATWTVVTVDSVPGGDDWRFSMQLNGGNPVISYFDQARSSLKLATCTAGCASPSPTWVITTVDSGSNDTGIFSSLQLDGGKPVIGYYSGGYLKLAACRAACDSAAPTWSFKIVDSSGIASWYPSLQIDASRAYLTYYDWANRDLKLAVVALDESDPPNRTAFWWDPAEPGWGLHINHQDNALFTLLYTYARDGQPMWLTGSNLQSQPDGSFTGELARFTGPAFNQLPWTPAAGTPVGSMTLRFTGADSAILEYSVNGVRVTKTIRPYVYASATTCVFGSPVRTSSTNYQDLWWNPSETGWGLALSHQGSVLFAGLFTYSATGRDQWIVGSSLARQLDGSFSGEIATFSGPAFDASPWSAFAATRVGTMTLRFRDGDYGTLTYNVSGAFVTKTIVRYRFGRAVPVCH